MGHFISIKISNIINNNSICNDLLIVYISI